jgi:hypothetical protein
MERGQKRTALESELNRVVNAAAELIWTGTRFARGSTGTS